MPTLTDTQLVILSAACQRPGRLVLPLSERIKGGAAQKVVAALIARGLVEEVEASQHDQIWRTTGEGPAVTLVATDAALAALGMEADSAHTSLVERPQGVAAQDGGSADTRTLAARTEPRAPKLRDGTKQARLIAMLERDEGATIEQIVAATGWQPHTVRGAIAGALKRKLGLTVASEKLEGERIYRILR